MSRLLTPKKNIIDPSPYGWFREKVRMALDLYSKIYPAQAKAVKDLAKQRRNTARDSRALWGERDDYVKGVMPRFIIMILGLKEITTTAFYGVPCGTGVKQWDLDDEMNKVFWEEAESLRISTYEGTPEMAKRRDHSNGVQ